MNLCTKMVRLLIGLNMEMMLFLKDLIQQLLYGDLLKMTNQEKQLLMKESKILK